MTDSLLDFTLICGALAVAAICAVPLVHRWLCDR